MKILDSIRSIASDRCTNIDPFEFDNGGGGPPPPPDHTHNNLPLLQTITDNPTHRYLKLNNVPIETHLLDEEW